MVVDLRSWFERRVASARNKMRKRLAKTASAMATAAAIMAGSADAATINWGAGDTTPTVGEVSTSGTLHEAFDVVTADSQVGPPFDVNGVTFTSVNLLGNNYAALNPSLPSFGDAGLDELYSHFGYGDPQDITITGLDIGTPYEIQLFYGDNRGCCSTRTIGVGTSEVGGIDVGGVPVNNGVIFTGTFTADATSQTFFTQLADAAGAPLGTELSGYQVRAIPEPATLSLLAMAGAGLLVAGRWLK